jgi:single-strand selective monofunctional uracil DNA glycosylase
MATIATEMQVAAQRLADDVRPLRFGPPVTHVYNPLDYAWAPHRRYIERYGATRKRVVLLGMNPGPFGMAQTGVPFGDVASVRDFLRIVEPVGRPPHEHPDRKIQGFACPRGEVSGTRVWGLVRALWGAPDAFFADHYVANYCPLVFIEDGKNRTPDKLPAGERAPLVAACDRHLRRMIELLAPEWVIGVGGYAEKQARQALAAVPGLKIGQILHPSPASPAANRGWAAAVAAELTALGLAPPSPPATPAPELTAPRRPRSRSASADR